MCSSERYGYIKCLCDHDSLVVMAIASQLEDRGFCIISRCWQVREPHGYGPNHHAYVKFRYISPAMANPQDVEGDSIFKKKGEQKNQQ